MAEFTARMAAFHELETCTAIDMAAIGSSYLPDVWNCFNTLPGAMICVNCGSQTVGIGRFTVLPDNTGWLETLRVLPQWQRQGVGKVIYREYFRLAQAYSCSSIGMFTGITNAASAGLAAAAGLSRSGQYHGCHLTELTGGCAHGFRHVNWQRATELVLPQREEYHDYMVFNRTFYHINRANARHFADEGKVFEDAASGSFLVCGARFQHHAALHIAMMGGDYDRCMDFAVNYARAQGLEKISCTFAVENEKLEAALKRRGFTMDPTDLITMEFRF